MIQRAVESLVQGKDVWSEDDLQTLVRAIEEVLSSQCNADIRPPIEHSLPAISTRWKDSLAGSPIVDIQYSCFVRSTH
jgi:hypothetical protein